MVETSDKQRAEWMGVMARAEAGALAARMAELTERPSHVFLRPPEFGAVMTRGRAGGSGGLFSMGEMTVTRCAVRLDGQPEVAGHAYVQGRNADKATHAAIADAMLQCPDLADVVMSTVVAPLKEAEAARRMRVRRKAGSSKVDFFTMVRAEG